MKRSTKTRIAVIAGLALLVLGLAGLKAGQIVAMVRAGESFAPPPEVVASAKAETVTWEAARPAIGSLVAVRGVTVGAELPGTVRQVGFESGSLVRAGTVLVRLDTSNEEAQLAAAVADASLARLSLERARRLRRNEANAAADLDAAEARAKQADATVANLRATIAKKTIRAPFDGRIAIKQVEVGQVVSPGTPVASLQSVTPIHADFWLPQQALAEVRAGLRVRMRTDAFPGADWEGRIATVNTEVDPVTRNVKVRATFENRDGRLRPGMFANVEVLQDTAQPHLVVPATAVMFAPYGDSVFALEERKDQGTGKATVVARQRFVRTGERRGDLVVVASGLKPGERVVSSGAFKLRNGAPVVVDDSIRPDAQLAPRPANE